MMATRDSCLSHACVAHPAAGTDAGKEVPYVQVVVMFNHLHINNISTQLITVYITTSITIHCC